MLVTEASVCERSGLARSSRVRIRRRVDSATGAALTKLTTTIRLPEILSLPGRESFKGSSWIRPAAFQSLQKAAVRAGGID